jgi:transcriptional regulator with XRE-family HTH domain
MSQDDLAQRARLDRTYISQLERHLKSPTLTSIEKLATCLGVDPTLLLKPPRGLIGPRVPGDYMVNTSKQVTVMREGRPIAIPTESLTTAINITHELIDDLYSIELDIATVLGMRNLSSFIGELVVCAILKTSNGLFRANPHQDGYPDLLLMDETGGRAWTALEGRHNEKAPFSPFTGGGVEVKATCGAIPSPAQSRRRGAERPSIGDTRGASLTGYDWKAHHRETNNLIGVLWDFLDRRPRIVAMFYSHELSEADWGRIVQPKAGGGRTTSVSIMNRQGVKKMYEGWLCTLRSGPYAAFLNARNNGDLIPIH